MAKTSIHPLLKEDNSCRLSVLTPEEHAVVEKIEQVLPQEQLTSLARECGAIQRQRKITPASLLGAFCLLSFHTSCSLRLVAMFMGILGGCVLTKQALAQRINALWVRLFERILGCTLAKAAITPEAKAAGVFSGFNRVLVQDSTSLAIPNKLAAHFPGSGNQNNKRNAMIRVQAILDLLSEKYVYFDITPFTHNDQRAATKIIDILSAGDLIIRDLGYFVPLVFQTIQANGAYFLSRYHHGTDLFHGNGDKIDLLPLLKKNPSLDMCVHLGKQAKVPVRLVCIPVPEEVANERRRKLREKQKRDRRLNPSNEQIALCGWEIFITNVAASIWTLQDVSNAYGLRWRIEIIFKAWKTHFNFAEFTDGSKDYVLLLLYSRLIFITLFQATYVGLDRWMGGNASGIHISILKFAQFFALILNMAFAATFSRGALLMANILKHCTYERRRHRLSYGDLTEILLS